jgi:protocatechuate 3,4-dioxygenase beta subunit
MTRDLESNDTRPDRRRALALMGTAGLGVVVAACTPVTGGSGGTGTTTTTVAGATTTTLVPGCILSASQEEGPYYVNIADVRSNITDGKVGVPLTLTFTVVNATTCTPLVGAAVDVWQADATGVYSDEAVENTVGQVYLRGTQLTDSSGVVTFTTIVPGWYAGRTMHIHMKVHTAGTASTVVHTGQVFFDNTVSALVAADSRYGADHITRTTNATDRVYTQQNGSTSVLTMVGSTTAGYGGSITLGVVA